MVFHIAVEFTDYDEPLVRKSSESGQIGRTVQSALARDGDKVEFACASGGEGPVLQFLGALGLNASPSTNRAMHDFVTNEQDVRKRFIYDLPVSIPYHNR